MVEQKHFPFYLATKPELLSRRAAVMLTYEQILSIANSLVLLQSRNNKPFSGVHLSDSELSRNTAVHNACINCAISLEEHDRIGDSNGEK